MPINLSKNLTLHQDLQIEMQEQLLASPAPNTEFMVEEIVTDGGLLYPDLKMAANTHGGIVTVAAAAHIQGGRLDVTYYRIPQAFDVDYVENGPRYPRPSNDVTELIFINFNSTHYGPQVRKVAAKTILDFFLCGGNFPDVEALRKEYPLWAQSYLR